MLSPLVMNAPQIAVQDTENGRAIVAIGLDMAQALYLFDSFDVEWSQVEHGREHGTWAGIDRLPA